MVTTKLGSVVLVLILTSLLAGDTLAQRKSRSRDAPRPAPKTTQDELVTSVIGSTGETEVKLKFSPAAAGYSQAFHIAAAFSDSTPESAVLSILSISNRYHYESHSSVQILVDGSRLSSKDKYDSLREAGVDNGNAVESLSVLLTLDELRRMTAASRVDITAWIDRFTLNTGSMSALRQFVAKVDVALEKAKLKPQATVAPSASPNNPNLTREFDATVDSLPPSFSGHDSQQIYKVLEERQRRLVKGEFETTEQFRIRSQREQSLPILGDLTVDSIYAFESHDLQDPEAQYDADQQTLRIAAIFANGSPPILHAGFHLIRFYRGKRFLESREWEGYRVEVANFNDFQRFTFRYIRIKDRPLTDMLSITGETSFYTKLCPGCECCYGYAYRQAGKGKPPLSGCLQTRTAVHGRYGRQRRTIRY